DDGVDALDLGFVADRRAIGRDVAEALAALLAADAGRQGRHGDVVEARFARRFLGLERHERDRRPAPRSLTQSLRQLAARLRDPCLLLLGMDLRIRHHRALRSVRVTPSPGSKQAPYRSLGRTQDMELRRLASGGRKLW